MNIITKFEDIFTLSIFGALKFGALNGGRPSVTLPVIVKMMSFLSSMRP